MARGALASLIRSIGVTVLIFAVSVLTATAVTALVGWSKNVAALVVIATVATVVGVAAVVSLES